MRKLYAGNGNPPPKDLPKREAPPPVDGEVQETDAGNGNPPPKDKIN